MAKFTIRRAIAADAKALAGCIDAAYSGYAGTIADLPAVSAGLDEDICENLVWVAERDGEIVGGAVLVIAGPVATLANVAVHPDAGGQGLGGALIQTVERHARNAGCSELRLATHIDMPANVALYARLGWRETSRHGNKVLMSKLL
jgi:GNAT superfamily N-acetyltransferase